MATVVHHQEMDDRRMTSTIHPGSNSMGSWYDALRGIDSRGSQAERPGSLAGLAAARRVHLGQFFTPDAVAAVMWRVVSEAVEAASNSNHFLSILDNSVGSGRLLQFADPAKHSLYGVDVDAPLIADVGGLIEQAGFKCDFEPCGMEAIHPHGFNLALINPPFSVHIESPLLEPFPCTSYGKFGPSTATVSHAYALAQAVEAAEVVVALLPRSFVDELVARPKDWLPEKGVSRLAGIYDLPTKSFKEEGTDVSTSLMVFSLDGAGFGGAPRHQLEDLESALPPICPIKFHGHGGNAKLSVRGVEEDKPSITLPVTGDQSVRITHDGRRMKLHYQCGLTQAKVANAILRSHVREEGPPAHLHRYPKGVMYCGEGVLDMEVHLSQDDPQASFETFVQAIANAGGNPVLAPGLREHFRRRARKSKRQATPLRHTVWVEEGVAGTAETLTASPKKPMVADSKVWGSPVLQPGQAIELQRKPEGGYSFSISGCQYGISSEDLYERFTVAEGAAQAGWTVVHEGLHAAFPEVSTALRAKAVALGIDRWLTWGYQLDDLIELAMKPQGTIAAWHMGLGKARLAAALILLIGCRHGLIVTEAGLIDEMVIELKGLPIPADSWQVITKPSQAINLRQINVISYERLRLEAPANGKGSNGSDKPKGVKRMHRTYAGLMRRRIGVLVPDEGDVLSNPQSDQTQALYQLSAKRRYVMTATPIANYPRDVAPILAFAAGDGTAAQPWGWRRGRLEQNWRQSMSHAERGLEAFRENFVTMEWATREFEDTLLEGAKREIPRINNLEKYRAMLAPHIKRRIIEEPEVARYIQIPKETREIVEVPWDDEHLAFYIKVAEEFAGWYAKAKEEGGRSNNLIAILARIRAVGFASDYPQHGVEGFGCYLPLTSKQRWVLDELEQLTAAGKKTVLYAENPGQVDMLHRHLLNRGIDAVRFHGKIPVKQRTQDLNHRFRFGESPILLATLGVTQKGLNLWQAEEEILLGRSWSATVEEQAIARLLRPQQKKNVRVRYVHLPGGIDIYKGQLVTFKRDSARAGIDWGTPETDGVEFLHLDTVLGRFAEDVAKMHNIKRWDLKEYLQKLAHQSKGALHA